MKMSKILGTKLINAYVGARGDLVLSFEQGRTLRLHGEVIDNAGNAVELDVPCVHSNLSHSPVGEEPSQ